ncbi:MAG: hypothetical protein A2077_00670 [Nitrospirae bacterium GWC2_46_6]|nr:MAG: hypothetical protein A2Z82_07240 [Nitrospirae bacterium GWA2_46_11]OGW21425.1 MAG: hypothetical protein A2077_00670 [Nitrospirae bacterium GWC2_46_6]OGW24615.1 MAG: hypothetical protein A2X55_06310 [Nitrospirae bacterium GWB2_47_37]HAK89167.1 hypothetical protein [Nitrospiraceae bacterium]HCL81725.1 hypothetical protein [Nitrospiraceae bacterium]
MTDKQLIAYLKLLHGTYNTAMMLLFMYQGLLGLRTRRNRMRGRQDFRLIKRHRKLGPILALTGPAGFIAGMIVIYLDKGRIMEYPLHFLTGLSIALLTAATFLISRKIKGPDSPWRTPHLMIGIFILCLYIIQVTLGLGILF